MYTLGKRDKSGNWSLLVEAVEDKESVMEALKESGWDGKAKYYYLRSFDRRRVLSNHKNRYVMFSSLLHLDKEPGPEFHKRMRQIGLTRAFIIS